MIEVEFDLRYRVAQIRFEMQHVVCARRNPRAALQRDRKHAAIVAPRHQPRFHVALLLEADFPRGLAAPLAQSFAAIRDIALVFRIEQKYSKSHESARSERRRKLTQVFAAVALFIEEERSFFLFADEDQ